MSNALSTPLDGPIVFFGDSLSDPGNLAAQAAFVLPPEVIAEIGDEGRASNGPVWAEVLPGLVGATEVLNFAVAGAEAAGSQPIGDFIAEAGLSGDIIVAPDDPALAWDMNLGAQIARFEAAVAGRDDLATMTAMILIGGNDYLALDLEANPLVLLAQFAATLSAIVDATVDAIGDLVAAGVGRIVVSSLPDFTFFPSFAGLDAATQALADQLSDLHNATLADALADLSGDGVAVEFLDLGPLTDAILEDQSSFGLIAPYTLTLTEGDPGTLAGFDEDQVAFWDQIHPTEATHGIIAAYSAFAVAEDPRALTADADVLNLSASGTGALVFAYGGADLVTLGKGGDIAFAGTGDDVLLGIGGGDVLSGGRGADIVSGGTGHDIVAGGEGADVVLGGAGNDVLIDGLGSDIAIGAAGADTFIWIEGSLIGGTAGADADVIAGGRGADSLYLVLSAETFATQGAALSAGSTAALAAIGITAVGIETIVVLEGRAALDALAGEDWYGTADLWGLI